MLPYVGLSAPTWPYVSLSAPIWPYVSLSAPTWPYVSLSAPIFLFVGLAAPIWLYVSISAPYPAIIIEGHYSGGGRDLTRRLLLKATTLRKAGTLSGDYY